MSLSGANEAAGGLNPLSRAFMHFGSLQHGECADIEMDYTKCASAVGHIKAKTTCKEYLADLNECKKGTKQMLRSFAMNKERRRQGRPHISGPNPDAVVINNDIY